MKLLLYSSTEKFIKVVSIDIVYYFEMVTEKEKTEEEDKPEVYDKDCPYCEKTFYSLSKKQLLFNYTSHIGSCKFKNKNKKESTTEGQSFTLSKKKIGKKIR